MKVIICETMLKPREVPVASSTGDGTVWFVTSPTLFNDSFCDCPGFQYRGECRHCKEVDAARCKWYTPVGKHQVSRCPMCNARTKEYDLEPEYDTILPELKLKVLDLRDEKTQEAFFKVLKDYGI